MDSRLMSIGAVMGKLVSGIFLLVLPYAAIGVGFAGLHSAWAATLFYHVVILGMWAWLRPPLSWRLGARPGLRFGLMGVCALCLPMIVLLWPWLVLPDVVLAEALASYGLGNDWWIFFGYIVFVHPVLEEVYWRGLAPDVPASDAAFAGFHVLLVAPFVGPVWIVLLVVILAGAGWVWRWTVRQTGGLGTAILSHAVADLCILLAIQWLR